MKISLSSAWLLQMSAILIVNEGMRSTHSLNRTLRELGYYTTLTAYSAKWALETAADSSPSVALLDLELPAMTGFQLAHELRSHRPSCVRRVPLLAVAQDLCSVPGAHPSRRFCWLPHEARDANGS